MTPTREASTIDLTIAARQMGGWHVLRVAGELDLASSTTLADRIALLPDGTSVALDLRGLTFIDSSGLSTVIAGEHRARDRGGRLAVVTADHGPVERIIVLTGVDQVIEVVRSTDDLGP